MSISDNYEFLSDVENVLHDILNRKKYQFNDSDMNTELFSNSLYWFNVVDDDDHLRSFIDLCKYELKSHIFLDERLNDFVLKVSRKRL